MNNVERLVRPSLRVARVIYYTDVTKAAAPVIPLGVFSEILLPQLHGLALKARSSLTLAETGRIGPLLRERLADPFSFLREEFEEAWDRAHPGKALDFLAERHATALSIPAAREFSSSISWLSFIRRSDTAEVKLSDAIDSEFAALLRDDRTNEPVPKRKLIEVDDRLAA
jgi:hypothetical protein